MDRQLIASVLATIMPIVAIIDSLVGGFYAFVRHCCRVTAADRIETACSATWKVNLISDHRDTG